VFLCKVNTPDVNYKIVEEEICEVEWVQQQNLQKFIDSKTANGCYFSPWFLKMHENGLLSQWWKAVIDGKVQDLH
jgi:isopentenyldiphosphate isomerase